MGFHNVLNNAFTTLGAGITDISATPISVVADVFPAVPFYLTIGDVIENSEVVEVVSKSGFTFIVNRAQDNTVAKTFPIGTKVQLLITAAIVKEITNQITVVNGIGGNVEKANKSDLDNTNNTLIFNSANVKYPPVGYAPAKGDGTTDDSAAIQALINYVIGLGGGTLYFPKGNYKIGTTINLAIGVSLAGVGKYVTQFLNLTGAACFQYIGVVECPALDTIYSGFSIQDGTGSTIGIRMRNAAGYKFVNVRVSAQYVGFQLSYGNHIAIQDCMITDCTHRGLLLSGELGGIGSGPFLDGLSVTNCGFEQNLYHIEHRGSVSTASATITGNHFLSYSSVGCIWLTRTKGIHIAGNWFELGATTKGIVLNVFDIDGISQGTPFGTAIIGNCFASQGTIFVDILEGVATVVEGNSFTGASVGGIHIATGAGRNYVGSNMYENFGVAYKVKADYNGLLDTSDTSLMPGRMRQSKAGIANLVADGVNGYATIAFDSEPIDWTKVSCTATWQTSTLSAYTDAPTQISWTQLNTIQIRLKAGGKTAGQLSYFLAESN